MFRRHASGSVHFKLINLKVMVRNLQKFTVREERFNDILPDLQGRVKTWCRATALMTEMFQR